MAVLVVAHFWGHGPALFAAAGAFLGHLFPVWLGFHGGKGVATYIGLLLALAWPVALAFCLIWLAVAALTRYSSLAALVASAATPVRFGLSGTGSKRRCSRSDAADLDHASRKYSRLLEGTEGRIGKTSDRHSSKEHISVGQAACETAIG